MLVLLSRKSTRNGLLFGTRLCQKIFSKKLFNLPSKHIDNPLVIISSSTDIFENLAFEDMIYNKTSFSPKTGKILLIWRDRPCIVIGRHQNAWSEVRLDNCLSRNIAVSRRNSGGGTVYHDMGNINLSFIGSRGDYNRRRNLEFISSCLKEKYGIETKISSREDLVLEPTLEKVSGTASKLSSKNSYHHCTLLVNVNLKNMRMVIKEKSPLCLKSNATSSVRSSVKNLISICPSISTDDCIESVAQSFVEGDHNRILVLDPKESVAPGIGDVTAKFKSWEWIFGKTPKFTLEKEFLSESYPFTIKIQVNQGVISEFVVWSEDRIGELKLDLKSIKFERKAIQEKILLWSLLEDDILWSSSLCKAVDSIIDEVCG